MGLAAGAGGLAIDPLAVVLVLAAAVLYLLGVTRLRSRGRPWPVSRCLLFGLGLVAVLVATNGPLAAADTERLSAHSLQHLLLGMIAPLLVALAAPLTLALQAGTGVTARRLRRILHSPVARLLSHPLVGIALFGGTLFALYLTPLLGLSLRNGLVHPAVHLHFFVAGAAFLWPIVAVDPVPGRPPHPLRLLAVFPPSRCTPSWASPS
jgi:putative membrane protein